MITTEFHLTSKYFKFQVLISIDRNHLVDQTINTNDDKKKKKKKLTTPATEQLILARLAKFEKNKKYLGKGMSLITVSKILKHNSKYVSEVISKSRNKSFLNYINSLKIDYVIEQLQTHSKFRNYTHKALSEIAGFGSTQTFVSKQIRR